MDKVIFFKVHHERKFISAFKHTKPIGIFRVDVATVYNEKEHAFERKWAQLVDPDAIQVTFGYLLLSVAITERGVSTKVKRKSFEQKKKIFSFRIFLVK